VDTVFLQRL
jgi:putative transposase